MNLVINARDAMRQRRHIRLVTEAVDVDSARTTRERRGSIAAATSRSR